ncbi:metal tolerance protein 5-like [Asparagus officinalis]|nr:metal tolerance protein 5-like [Asparagus officinalis]
MATLCLQIILESVRSLVSDEDGFSLTKEQETWVVNINGLVAALLANYVKYWIDPVGAMIAIRHIDTVRAYTFGSHYFVEVDIVLSSEMPLREAHDIGTDF